MDWDECARYVKTKTNRQCYDQYTLQGKNLGQAEQQPRHKWTKEELDVLSQKRKQDSWDEFQQTHFPQFTISQLKNQLRMLKKEEEDERLEKERPR